MENQLQKRRILAPAKFSASPLLFSACLLMLLGGSVLLRNSIEGLSEVSYVQDGINTCFKRVYQGFLAFTIGKKKSRYLGNEFSQSTQECFGEIISAMEERRSDFHNRILDKINTFTTNLHWFYKDLKSLSGNDDLNGRNKIVSKYVNLEAYKEEALEESHSYQRRLHLELKKGLMLVGGGMLTMLLWTGLLAANGRKEMRIRREFEREASRLLEGEHSYIPMVIEGFFKKCLEQYGLFKSELLFTKYNDFILDQGLYNFSGKGLVEGELVRMEAIGVRDASLPAEVKDRHTLKEGQKTFLSKSLMNIVGQYAEKLFAQGIILDADVGDGIWINMNEDGFKKAISHLLDNFITNLLSQKSRERKITLSNKIIGGTVIIKLTDSGPGFDKTNLRIRNAFEEEFINWEPNLEICKKLVENADGKIVFGNEKDHSGNVTGAKAELILLGGLSEGNEEESSKRGVCPGKLSEMRPG